MSTATAAPAGKIQPRLKQKYRNEIVPALTEEFGFTNPHQVPGLVKVVEAHRRPRLDEWTAAMADPPLLAEVGHLPRPPLVNGGDCGRQVGGRERARTDDPKIVRHEDSPRCLQAHASVRP